MANIDRKLFLRSSFYGATGLLLFPSILSAQDPNKTKGPPLVISEVKEFVGAAHKDFPKVREMLSQNPELLNAVNNLGGWDWEDAVSAAGHVGLSEMAEFLLQQGARLTLCVAAMLGKTELVKTTIDTFPYMKNMEGPHKISLMRHAKAGGEKSLEILDFLKSVGAKE